MYHCSTFSVAFLCDLYAAAGIICPQAVSCRQETTRNLESSLQCAHMHPQKNFNQVMFSFMSTSAVLLQVCVATLVFPSPLFQFRNAILHRVLIEVPSAVNFHLHTLVFFFFS